MNTRNKMQQDTKDGIISEADIREIMKGAMKEHADRLEKIIDSLKNEIIELKQSNIQLLELVTKIVNPNDSLDPEISLTSAGSSLETIVERNDSGTSDCQTNKTESAQSSFEGLSRIKLTNHNVVDKKIRLNKRTKDMKSQRQQNIVIGEKRKKENEDIEPGFRTRESKLWLYVGRCDPKTEVSQLNEYLKANSPNYNFEIHKLESKDSTYSSFRVGAHKDLHDVLYDANYWPQGILIKRFRFFRARSGISVPATSNNTQR